MASFIRHVRQTAGKPVLLLDAGDNIIGTRWDSWYRGKATAHFLNQLKIDAMTLGNHEFDYGADSLLEYLNKMDHPALCCNMNPNGHGLGNRVRRSVVKEVGGVKVGIVGLTTRYTNEGSRPWPAQITREHVAARECIKQLKQQGVQIIIALSHLGYNADKWLAQQVADIDIVIGGHAHAFLWSGSQAPVLRKNNGKDVRDSAVGPYPTWVRSRVQPWRRIIVLQAFWASRYVGKLDVKFNQDGELAWAQGKPHLMGGPGSNSVVQPDWAMKRSIQTWKKW